MTEKLTPWYDPKVDGQPVRVGLYERNLLGLHGLDWWDGRTWRYGKSSPPMNSQSLKWRGLTEPNEEKPNGKD